MPEQKVKIGLIGTGFMAHAHSSCYLMTNKANLINLAGSSREKALKMAEEFQYVRYTDEWQKIIEDPDVDMVDICAPNFLHRDIAVACAKAKKDFVIEKPLARNLQEADEIIEAIEKYGVKAYYSENLLFAPNFLKVREIIEQGGIGNPFMIRLYEMHDGPFHAGWFWDAEKTGGGTVIDMGIHGLCAAEWLMGSKMTGIFAITDTVKWSQYCKNGTEDNALAIMRFENGAVGTLMTSWAISGGMETGAEIFGTSGNAYIDAGHGACGVKVFSAEGYGKDLNALKGDRPHPIPTRGWHFPVVNEFQTHGHLNEIREFVEAKLENRLSKSTIYDGRRALELVNAIYSSSKTGQFVHV